jgi:hypothetical protein
MRYVFVKPLKDLCPKWDECISLDTHFWRLHVLEVKFGHITNTAKSSQSLVSRSSTSITFALGSMVRRLVLMLLTVCH